MKDAILVFALLALLTILVVNSIHQQRDINALKIQVKRLKNAGHIRTTEGIRHVYMEDDKCDQPTEQK